MQRIGLVGGECSGKSTLAAALAAALPGCLVEEALRDFVAERGRTPGPGEQAALLADQTAREEAAAAACTLPWLIVDPAPLMTAVYSELYFADSSLLAAAADRARGYRLVVWCDPGIPWVADGLHRDGREHRAAADDLIAAAVREQLEPRGVRVLRVAGSTADRVAAVASALAAGEGVATPAP